MVIKPDLRVVVMEGMSMNPKYVLLSFTSSTTTLSPLSPYASLLMPTAEYNCFVVFVGSRSKCIAAC